MGTMLNVFQWVKKPGASTCCPWWRHPSRGAIGAFVACLTLTQCEPDTEEQFHKLRYPRPASHNRSATRVRGPLSHLPSQCAYQLEWETSTLTPMESLLGIDNGFPDQQRGNRAGAASSLCSVRVRPLGLCGATEQGQDSTTHGLSPHLHAPHVAHRDQGRWHTPSLPARLVCSSPIEETQPSIRQGQASCVDPST